jgi:Spore coat protein Z.
MNCNNNNNIYDDVTETLEKIIELQRREVIEEIGDVYCDFDVLGELECHPPKCNTRPIQVFTGDDRPWHCPVSKEEDGCDTNGRDQTCVFRAERIQNGAVVLRALKEKHCAGENETFNALERFEATDSFITVKLGCICALRCMRDTYVDLCTRN